VAAALLRGVAGSAEITERKRAFTASELGKT
jgi:hypothetical protein